MKSLRVRLIVSYMVLAVLLLGLTGAVFFTVFVNYGVQQQHQRLAQAHAQARVVIEGAGGDPQATLAQLRRLFPEYEITIVPLPRERLVLTQPRAGTVRLFGPGGPDDFTFNVAALRPGGPPVVYRLSLASVKPADLWRDLYPRFAAVLAAGAALAALIGFAFSRWLARPIGRLTAATAAVAAGNFQLTVPPTGTRELDVLVEQFNRMAGRLQESFRSLAAERDAARRFAADAAHELRTPLTALRTYTEVAAEQPQRRQLALEATARQIQRLERIFEALIRMATLSEAEATHLACEEVNEVVHAAEPSLRLAAEAYGHTLVIEAAAPPVMARYDPNFLELALMNLVDNACKFTPRGGTVTIRVAREGNEAVLSVQDNGRGIPADELPNIFRRFHRGIDTQDIPGSGLGLSIVDEAVSRMHGRVAVTSTVGAGSCFSIYLPVCSG